MDNEFAGSESRGGIEGKTSRDGRARGVEEGERRGPSYRGSAYAERPPTALSTGWAAVTL